MIFAPQEKGQGLVEYALLIVFVAMVVIFFISLFGNGVGNLYSTIIDYL